MKSSFSGAYRSYPGIKMKFLIRLLLAAAIFLFQFSCAPKIRTGITHPLPLLADSARLVILTLEDSLVGKPSVYIGNTRFGDAGFSTNCNYNEEIEMLKGVARKNGANLIKITGHKDPDKWSSCDRIQADLYFDADNQDFEKQLEWSPGRRLEWRDFKKTGKQIDDTTAGAYTFCGIIYRYHVLTMFSKPYYSVRAYMDCRSSWVREDQKYRPDLLAHEQVHFDICEIYARELRKRLKEARIGPFEFQRESSRIYREVQRAMSMRQDEYDFQTNHGLHKKIQQEWQERIEKELSALNGFEDKTD